LANKKNLRKDVVEMPEMSFYNQGAPISTMTDNLIMELILKYARGSVLSQEEYRILREWEAASRDNKALLESFGDQEWLEERLKEMQAVPSQEMWHTIRQRIGAPAEVPVTKPSPVYPMLGGLAIAALLAILLIQPRLLREIFSRTATVQPSATRIAEVSVSRYRRSGPVEITLPDGSKVKLSYASRLRYPEQFAGSTREVELTGEASFDIAKQSDHPFILHAGRATVQVLGTFFNVRAYPDEPDAVTLISGALKVSDSAGKIARVMKPAERAVVSGSDIRVVHCEHPETNLSWSDKDPAFHFDNTDLHAVVRELARWYEVDVVDSLPVSGMPITAKDLPMRDPLDAYVTLINYTEIGYAHIERHGRQLILRGPVMH
jgi:ferric-dicitrate binding protein FerR (iron transport regulator)